MTADGFKLLSDEGAGTNLARQGHGFERLDQVTRSGRANVKDDEAGSDRGGAIKGFEGVTFRQAAGGGAGIGKFIGIGMGPKDFHGHRTKVMENLDFRCPAGFVFCKNPRPKGIAGVVAELDF
jgi:hypothetical protein